LPNTLFGVKTNLLDNVALDSASVLPTNPYPVCGDDSCTIAVHFCSATEDGDAFISVGRGSNNAEALSAALAACATNPPPPLVIPPPSAPPSPSAVFINEIHYDNKGGDTQEGVEIAGPAHTDLSGWKVLVYSGDTGGPGTDNSGNSLDIQLSGVIDDEGDGFGAVWFPGLLRNANYGLALVNGEEVDEECFNRHVRLVWRS